MTTSTELARDFCDGIGPLQLGVVLVLHFFSLTIKTIPPVRLTSHLPFPSFMFFCRTSDPFPNEILPNTIPVPWIGVKPITSSVFFIFSFTWVRTQSRIFPLPNLVGTFSLFLLSMTNSNCRSSFFGPRSLGHKSSTFFPFPF